MAEEKPISRASCLRTRNLERLVINALPTTFPCFRYPLQLENWSKNA